MFELIKMESNLDLIKSFKPIEKAPIRTCDLYLQSIIQEAVFSNGENKADEISIYNTIYNKIETNSIEDVKRVLDLIRINKRILKQEI